MDNYRRANVFKRVLALYGSTSVGTAKTKIQHLLYRASQVGGSTTLITRATAISWVQFQMPSANSKEASVLVAIAQQLYDSCDRERIDG
jgi:nucleolar pre-ribosomal-associated protein 1